MNIDLHTLTWNESDIIRLVLRYYKKFCRTLYVYDNHSTDNTREIAEEEGAIVKLFGSKFFDDQENMNLKNSCWKGSDADWVIVCDADEILFFSYAHTNDEYDYDLSLTDLHTHLQIEKDYGTTIIKTIGWQIMSNAMPKIDLLEITNGYEFSNYAKNVIFSPKAIQEINYGLGSHDCRPTGLVSWSDESMYVLHYKHIGGLQRTINRYQQYKPRMSPFNRKHGHGKHYNRSVSSLKQEWNERMAKSTRLI